MNELFRQCLFLPPQASTYAVEVDWLHYFIILTTLVGSAGVTVVGGYFVIRYGRSKTQPLDEPPRPDRAPRTPMQVELGLIVFVTVLFFVWWILGMLLYTRIRVAPPNAMRVYVTAKQWMWKFEYPQGKRSIGDLYVPSGRPVELVMSSRDVIHSFYVPAFRDKMDLVPGRTTTTWFQVTKPGRYEILCAEYCGTGHSIMRGNVVAMTPRDYERWLNGGSEQLLKGPQQVSVVGGKLNGGNGPQTSAPSERLSLAAQGIRVAARQGCLKCHSLDGSPNLGPSWLGLYHRKVKLESGEVVLADDAYITESMMDPNAQVVAGYPAKMPSYHGQLAVPEVAQIIELIRSLQFAPLPSEQEELLHPGGGEQQSEQDEQEHEP